MRRCLTGIIGYCFLVFVAHASSLHVHSYFDHEHNEHDHAPALHEHVASVATNSDAPHIEACDPSAHVVRISYTASAGSEVHPLGADIAVTTVVTRPPAIARVVQLLDIRQHSPPSTPFQLLRAPPLQTFL